MPDYTKSSSNQPKNKSEEAPDKPEKKIEKVVEGDVVIKKHGLGRKFKDVVVAINFRGLSKHVFRNIILPYSQKMAYDAWVESGNRVVYRDSAVRRPMIDTRGIQRSIFNYQGISSGSPISRASSIPLGRGAPPREIGPRASASLAPHPSRPGGQQYLFSSKEDATRVLDVLRESLDMYQEPISLAELYEAMGLPSSPVDQKWGWDDLSSVKLLQSNEGYILDFPAADSIQ